ncbi:MAG: hypothetical protein QOE06_240, partial [Thermoleophilaceae bacterium]|nr:hypothetical protein [Thermoleophilaceae bacterium]
MSARPPARPAAGTSPRPAANLRCPPNGCSLRRRVQGGKIEAPGADLGELTPEELRLRKVLRVLAV